MQSFEGKIAVVTGGGTGMGRELAHQLASAGCHVSMCDVSDENMLKARELCLRDAPTGTRVTTFVADVSDPSAVLAFREHVLEEHDTDHIQPYGGIDLDVIAEARATFDLPLAAYHVSGEFAMLKAAAQSGWLDERAVIMESLLGIRRAGADVILPYFAPQAAAWLAE